MILGNLKDALPLRFVFHDNFAKQKNSFLRNS